MTFGKCYPLLLVLAGCSLSAPEKSELFAPANAAQDAAQPEAGRDAATSEDAGADLDSGNTDAGSTPGNDASSEDAGHDAGPVAFDPQAGLVVHYRFNETTGNTVNDYAGDKDALIVGTPGGFEQWVSPGRIDGALKLSGEKPDGGTGHYVELPQGILLGQAEASIALWVNRAGGPMWQRVFDFGSGPPDWLYFTPVGGTGLPVVAGRTPALIFVDFIAIPDAPAGEGTLKINQAIPVSTWVHVTITWSASQIRAYLNGKLVAETVTHGQIAPSDLGNTSQNYLGRSQFPADPTFNGMIDDFRIYDRVLSASDVMQLSTLQ